MRDFLDSKGHKSQVCSTLQIGLGGVGRRSCVRLAGYISGCRYYQFSSSCGCEEAKEVVMECGVRGCPCVLLVTEVSGDSVSLCTSER